MGNGKSDDIKRSVLMKQEYEHPRILSHYTAVFALTTLSTVPLPADRDAAVPYLIPIVKDTGTATIDIGLFLCQIFGICCRNPEEDLKNDDSC